MAPTLLKMERYYIEYYLLLKIMNVKNNVVPTTPAEITDSVINKVDTYTMYNIFTAEHEILLKQLILSYKKKPKKIAYLITLSARFPEVDNKALTDAYFRIKNYKKFKIQYIYGVIEKTKKGHPHLHIYCETAPKCYIRLDRLKRIWKHSAIDIRRSFEKKGVDNYLSKDSDAIRLK